MPQRLRWLHTTVGNLAISAFRRNEAFGDRLPRLEAAFRPAPADTHAEAVSGIALERCWRAIEALPPQQHAVAVMRWLFAMTNSQIAAALGIAERNRRGPPVGRAGQAESSPGTL